MSRGQGKGLKSTVTKQPENEPKTPPRSALRFDKTSLNIRTDRAALLNVARLTISDREYTVYHFTFTQVDKGGATKLNHCHSVYQGPPSPDNFRKSLEPGLFTTVVPEVTVAGTIVKPEDFHPGVVKVTAGTKSLIQLRTREQLRRVLSAPLEHAKNLAGVLIPAQHAGPPAAYEPETVGHSANRTEITVTRATPFNTTVQEYYFYTFNTDPTRNFLLSLLDDNGEASDAGGESEENQAPETGEPA